MLLLGAILLSVLLAGLALAIAIAVVTISKNSLYSQDLCLSADCVERFTEDIEPALQVAKATFDLGTAIATIGGIFVALLSYLNSASTAALTNHIEHLKIFTEYIESELKKRDRLSPSSFDILLLYGKIFSQSRLGRTTVSDEYRRFLHELNSLISESNERCSIGTPGGFSYREHQRRVREHLGKVGIAVYIAPRNDYFEMENQLFDLLHRISQSFCTAGALPAIASRTYH